jgi:hypothetical protein
LGCPVGLKIFEHTDKDKDGGFKIIRRRWVIFSSLRRNRLMAHYEPIATVAVYCAKLAVIWSCLSG